MQQSRRIVALALVALLVATLAVQEARAFHKLKHKKIAKLLIIAKALHPKVIPIIPFHITKHTKVPVHYPATTRYSRTVRTSTSSCPSLTATAATAVEAATCLEALTSSEAAAAEDTAGGSVAGEQLLHAIPPVESSPIVKPQD
ncbi:hypothetical protein HPB52_015465 [Rhipicephalus sanguineus]|uniref:Uncharacterized protein n=1 Tax=Rhipicephalus sanguineus TaxID=34632 RepID=A0A9D4PUD3_RHISA|nr:hypothetical protein HPB52_015465 [Rhipicephalus sanguineus]